jgi:hypothetical protein
MFSFLLPAATEYLCFSEQYVDTMVTFIYNAHFNTLTGPKFLVTISNLFNIVPLISIKTRRQYIPAVHGIQRFITTLTRAFHLVLSSPKPIQSTPPHYYLSKIHINPFMYWSS